MDGFVIENPKAASYIVYLSAVVVMLAIAVVFYYTKSQEYLGVLKVKNEKLAAKPKPAPKKESSEDTKKEDGFTIIEAAD